MTFLVCGKTTQVLRNHSFPKGTLFSKTTAAGSAVFAGSNRQQVQQIPPQWRAMRIVTCSLRQGITSPRFCAERSRQDKMVQDSE
eukprot:5001147-Amphidinium_carterae.1